LDVDLKALIKTEEDGGQAGSRYFDEYLNCY